MAGLHTGDDLLAAIVLPLPVQRSGVDHVLGRRTTVNLKPHRDARLLLIAKPAAPIFKLAPVIHRGGAEIQQGDAVQVAAEGVPVAVAHDPDLAVRQNAFQPVPCPSRTHSRQPLSETIVVHRHGVMW